MGGRGGPRPYRDGRGDAAGPPPRPHKVPGQYLPLLELSVEEEPEDDRNTHYLGREYMYRGRWDDCIRTLEHHLSMPTATWKDERAASMRYIALSWLRKGDRARARTGISVPLQRPPICGSRIWI